MTRLAWVSIGFDGLKMGYTGLTRVRMGSTGFKRVSKGETGFKSVLLGSHWFPSVRIMFHRMEWVGKLGNNSVKRQRAEPAFF